MSDKYTTGQLIAWASNLRGTRGISVNVCNAIIAKLRAADKLCEAANKVRLAVSVYALPQDSQAFDKAINDCEEEG